MKHTALLVLIVALAGGYNCLHGMFLRQATRLARCAQSSYRFTGATQTQLKSLVLFSGNGQSAAQLALSSKNNDWRSGNGFHSQSSGNNSNWNWIPQLTSSSMISIRVAIAASLFGFLCGTEEEIEDLLIKNDREGLAAKIKGSEEKEFDTLYKILLKIHYHDYSHLAMTCLAQTHPKLFVKQLVTEGTLFIYNDLSRNDSDPNRHRCRSTSIIQRNLLNNDAYTKREKSDIAFIVLDGIINISPENNFPFSDNKTVEFIHAIFKSLDPYHPVQFDKINHAIIVINRFLKQCDNEPHRRKIMQLSECLSILSKKYSMH